MGLLDFLARLFGTDDGLSPEARQRRRELERASERDRPQPARQRERRRPGGSRFVADDARLSGRGLPVLQTASDLAGALGINERELAWLADSHRFVACRSPHYRLVPRAKRSGLRVILAPRPKLKAAQLWILRHVLDPIAPHEASHGFARGRSTRTNAAQHVARDVVVQLDIKDFFHQFTYRHVVGLFRAHGYGLGVARLLALLTTAPQRQMTPLLAEEAKVGRAQVAAALAQTWKGTHHPMLPQGAPTSPALANLLCRRLDRRFDGLAKRFGATYTRYADDLTFSGGAEFRRDLRRFVPLAKRIVREERLQLAPGKLRFARKGGRQQVTGLVVNERVNTPAADYRRLRATLHNCARFGPATQNRDGHANFREHLIGRIAHHNHANPARGERLRAQFDRIVWEA